MSLAAPAADNHSRLGRRAVAVSAAIAASAAMVASAAVATLAACRCRSSVAASAASVRPGRLPDRVHRLPHMLNRLQRPTAVAASAACLSRPLRPLRPPLPTRLPSPHLPPSPPPPPHRPQLPHRPPLPPRCRCRCCLVDRLRRCDVGAPCMADVRESCDKLDKVENQFPARCSAQTDKKTPEGRWASAGLREVLGEFSASSCILDRSFCGTSKHP